MNIRKTIYLTPEKHEDMIDHRSYAQNLSSCEIKAWKKFIYMQMMYGGGGGFREEKTERGVEREGFTEFSGYSGKWENFQLSIRVYFRLANEVVAWQQTCTVSSKVIQFD